MKTLKDIGDIEGKRVIVRLGLNVPIDGDLITDDYRIQKSLPTLKFLRDAGAKIIIIAHIGRKKTETLKPVYEYLSHTFSIKFVPDIMKPEVKDIVESMESGDIVMFENLRRHSGEEKNDPDFYTYIASFGDVYVNDAFAVAHRDHASITGIPKILPAYAGHQFEQEILNLKKAFEPEHPFVFILGGAKVETKLPLMEQFVGKADTVFVGGVLANDFYKAEGKFIGKSVTSEVLAPIEIIKNESFMLPTDVVVLRGKDHVTVSVDDIQKKDQIFDAGTNSINHLIEKIMEAKLIVWNGPLGYCEKDFCNGTIEIAKAIAKSNAYSIVGGGDSLAAIPDDIQEKFSFVSTGGGSMLDFLADGNLPALKALE